MRHRPLAVVGLVILGAIAYSLIRGRVDLDVAGIRAAIVFACLVAIDRVVMPVVDLMIGDRRAATPDPPHDDASG